MNFTEYWKLGEICKGQRMNEGAPKTFGQYTIQQKLGAGGMGVVYKAFDNKLQRTVAIKMITSQDCTAKEIERFLREAQSMARLNHPNIIKIYDIGGNPKPFIAMEFLEGNDLSTLFKMGKIKTPQLIKIITDIAKALVPTHKAGIVHRDIKPANIMVTNDNVAKLMDFGLAKTDKAEQGLSKSGSVIGTPAYMPPEQVAGEVKPTNDIYSLGASLYEGLTGRPPFEGESYVNMLSQVILGEPIPPRDLNPDISVYLEAICLKCMSKKLHKRYQSAEELVNDLKNFSKGRSITAKPYTKIDRIKKTISQNKAISVVVSLSIILIAFFGIASFLSYQSEKEIRSKLESKNEDLKSTKKELESTNKDLMSTNEDLISTKKELEFKNEKLILKQQELENALFQMFYCGIDLADSQNKTRDHKLAEQLTRYIITFSRLSPEGLLSQNKQIIRKYLMGFLMGSNQDKIKIYSEIIDEDPFIVVLTSRIDCYIDLKQYQNAKADCAMIRKLNPVINIVNFFEAKISFREKKYEQALEQIQKVFTTQVEDHGVYRLRGQIYEKLGKYELAIKDFSSNIERKKSDALAFFHRGYSYFFLKDYKKALSDYNKSINFNPEAYYVHFSRINVYKKLGEKEKLITACKFLASKFFEQKKYAKSIALWRTAIKAGVPRKELKEKIKKARQLKAKK